MGSNGSQHPPTYTAYTGSMGKDTVICTSSSKRATPTTNVSRMVIITPNAESDFVIMKSDTKTTREGKDDQECWKYAALAVDLLSDARHLQRNDKSSMLVTIFMLTFIFPSMGMHNPFLAADLSHGSSSE
jgi:hypothetical protein